MSGATLFADIQRRGLAPLPGEFPIETEFLVGGLAKAEVFVADNVASWFRQQRGGRLDPGQDLPCIVPPFAWTWIEWRDQWDNGVDRVGVLFVAQDCGDDEDGGTARIEGLFRRMANNNVVGGKERELSAHDPLRWILYALPVARSFRTGPVGPIKAWVGALNPQGAVALMADGGLMNVSLYPLGTEPGAMKAFAQLMVEGFLTLAFLNCRNVVSQEHLPSRQERRAAQRNGDPITVYRTLTIEPMRHVLEAEGGVATNGLTRALHICRGHFAHYSEEKPLFGKYAGQFWIPAHTRGSIEAGAVAKDYAVSAPREA